MSSVGRSGRFLPLAFRWAFFSTCIAASAGCATQSPPFRPDARPAVEHCRQHGKLDDPRLFQIYIDADGRLLDPTSKEAIATGDRRARRGGDKSAAIEEAARTAKIEEDTEAQYVDRIIETFRDLKKADDRYQLTIFIHGGLNSFQSSTERVTELRQPMLDECRYPLFISWDSGWGGNYFDHLFFVRRGVRTPAVAVLGSPFVLAEDVGRSVIRAVPALVNNNQQTFSSSEAESVLRSVDSIAKEGRIALKPASLRQLLDKESPIPDPYTLPNPVRFVAIPFVDGFGSGAYASMQRRTELILRKRRDDRFPTGNVPSTAATRFFLRWQADAQRRKATSGREEPISLFAHSMGTLIANDILSNFPRVVFDRIVYMAAACRVADLKAVANYLLVNRTAQFFSLSLHPQREIWERSYADFTPRGSLLIWIDQFLGSVNSFGDRTAGFFRNLAPRASDLFDDPSIKGRVTLTVFDDQPPSPTGHGDFDAFRFWRPGFRTADDCTPIKVPGHLGERSQGCFKNRDRLDDGFR